MITERLLIDCWRVLSPIDSTTIIVCNGKEHLYVKLMDIDNSLPPTGGRELSTAVIDVLKLCRRQ